MIHSFLLYVCRLAGGARRNSLHRGINTLPIGLVAPTLPYGATDDLVGYPGTVSLGVQGLYNVLSSITQQLVAYGARRFVFLNGHGGNVKSLSMVSMDLNDAGCLAAVVNWWKVAPQLNPAWGGGHGGAMETSANLAIDPASVDMSQVTDEGLLHDIGEDMQLRP